MKNVIKTYLFVVLIFSLNLYGSAGNTKELPLPKVLDLRVQFWINIFTKYSVDNWVIHDSDNPEIVYSVVNFKGTGLSRKARLLKVKNEKQRIAKILKRIGTGKLKPRSMSEEEKRIYLLLGADKSLRRARSACARVRVQQGMRETFMHGIIRSGFYVDHFKKIFRDYDVPEDLVYLPHVESSFNPYAISRSGAKGMWQFTYSTGKRFLKINRSIDERFDPFLSAEAAARYLSECYDELESWPLAITAYNHGIAGVRRAAVAARSEDIGRIVTKYRSRRFGFASRNFYTEFIAACHVAKNSNRYFPGIRIEKPAVFRVFTLTKSVDFNKLTGFFNMEPDELKRYNPAFLKNIYNGSADVPAGYKLRLPVSCGIGEKVFVSAPDTTQKDGNTFGIEKFASLLAETVFRFVSENLQKQAQPEEKAKALDLAYKNSHKDSAMSGLYVAESTIDSAKTALYVKFLSDTALQLNRQLKEGLEIHNGYLTVYPEETLGHYAEWLNVPTWKLRLKNNLRYGQTIKTGQKIKLDFSRVSRSEFERRRLGYHTNLLKNFLCSYTIRDSVLYRIKRGDTLWSIVNNKFGISAWLVFAFNPDKNLTKIKPGDILKIPVLQKKLSDSI